MQRTCAALSSICGSKCLVPPWPCEVEPAAAQRDLRALLAIALRSFSSLDAGTLGQAKLLAPYHCPRHKISFPNKVDCGPERACWCTARMQVIQLLIRCGVDAHKDSDLRSNEKKSKLMS